MRKLVRKPFKGYHFYEWQIGPLVFQWPIRERIRTYGWGGWKPVWIDHYWNL